MTPPRERKRNPSVCGDYGFRATKPRYEGERCDEFKPEFGRCVGVVATVSGKLRWVNENWG